MPDSYASQIPSIAFSIPDLDGTAKMELTPIDGGDDLACIQSNINNGKSMSVEAVSYVAAGIAGAALLMTGVSALASAGAGAGAGAVSPSPSFGEVMGWFQGMAMNGMMSVNYPSVYTSFTKNFGFSTGLIPWGDMQESIDNFRKSTGGNLTEASYAYLRNATIVHTGNTNNTKRDLDTVYLYARDSLTTNVNGTESSSSDDDDDDDSSNSKVMEYVNGIKGYVEELTIPRANVFMTILLVFAIVIGAIAVGILLLKVILETWALFGSFPAKLTNFRKRYWWILAKTITNLILLLYGVWVLYCIYQFTNGDSWAAKVLAGVTLGLFSAVLAFFAFRIWSMARKFKKAQGDASGLFEDKETWRKYSLFYENYKKGYWWLFVPVIVYSFAKGCVIAGLDGHGLAQTGGQLVIEALMLCLLLWSRPYTLKSSNVINITIQVVRVLSVVCVLVFVEELGISQTTKTVTGVVLIVMQSVLTGVLAILIAVNSIIVCCKENPHRKRRKEQGKFKDNDSPAFSTLISLQRSSTAISTTSLLSTLATLCSWTLPSTRASATLSSPVARATIPFPCRKAFPRTTTRAAFLTRTCSTRQLVWARRREADLHPPAEHLACPTSKPAMAVTEGQRTKFDFLLTRAKQFNGGFVQRLYPFLFFEHSSSFCLRMLGGGRI